MCARQFVYEGLEDKYWNKINKDACDYQKVIKPGNSLTNVVDEKLMDKNVKERNKFIFGDKEFRIVIIKRYIKYFCLQGVGLAATIGIVTLIALYWL